MLFLFLLPRKLLSRCETFTFKKPSNETLKKAVLDVCKKEEFVLSDSSAELISILGDGSFRDTLNIVQKILSVSADKKISEEEVRLVTGAPKAEIVNEVVSSISEKNLANALGAVEKATNQNVDMAVFLKLILQLVRAILLIRFGGENIIKSTISEKEYDFAKKMANQNTSFNSEILSELLTAYIQSLPLELALIKIISREN
jgi:DNA polymerase III subunit gamma/tau